MAVEVQKLCVLFYYQQSPSLGAGYPLLYWKWYRTATAEEVGNSYISNALNGYTPQEMCVHPHFSNSKEEVLTTGLLTPKTFEVFVVKKAVEYMKTQKVKRIRCRPFVEAYDPLHTGIKDGSQLTPMHLHALILWCDFIKFRVKLIESLSGDNLENVKSENSKFFWVSKSLRELVAYFGSDGHGYCMNGMVKGPFYSASREVENLSGFCIGFNIPTATTKILPVTLRMAGSHGMVIKVGNQSTHSKYQPLFDTTWISTFFEEEEYLWFGSLYPLRVEDVLIMETAASYRSIIAALYIFDAAVSGPHLDDIAVSTKEMKILDFCLKYARNETMENEDKPDGVDDYILDSVKAFCAKKRKLTLDLHAMSRRDQSLQNMILYGVSWSESIPSDRTNIFRSELFVQFPNLAEIEMEMTGYPLNLLCLLSVLDEGETLNMFQLKLIDQDQTWMKNAFLAVPNVKELFVAKNWLIEFETIVDDDEDDDEDDDDSDDDEDGTDCIFIKKIHK